MHFYSGPPMHFLSGVDSLQHLSLAALLHDCLHARVATFQMAEVVVSRSLFQQILVAIAALRPSPPARS